jgi:hypothetical protein
VPIKAKLIIDHVMIAGSILILNIFQKEEVARTDAKKNKKKIDLNFDVNSIQKNRQLKEPTYLENF